jgi:hypothetical protein
MRASYSPFRSRFFRASKQKEQSQELDDQNTLDMIPDDLKMYMKIWPDPNNQHRHDAGS